MQALILAGGRGTRLQPYTTVLPKPLMPIGEYPVLDIVLRQLRNAGVTDVILAVGYLGHLFQAYFEDGARYDLDIAYSFESEPLGTAGPIALVIDQLAGDFFAMNGDLLTSLDFQSLMAHHKANKASATISLHSREVKIDYGIVEYDERGILKRYNEKPTLSYDVSMGINVLNAQAIKPYLVSDRYLDMPDLLMQMRDDDHIVACYKEECYWLDIGRQEDYQIALDEFEANKSAFLTYRDKE